MKKTYHGGCHCGAVRFEADLNLQQGTFKCNCSICTKARNWLTMIPPDDFRLQAGDADLQDYQFGARKIHHLFCRHCGIHSFGWGNKPDGEKIYAVNVNCLEDVDIAELVAAPVTCIDGRHDKWQSPPEETRHL